MLRYTYIDCLVNSVPDGSDWSIWHLQPFDLQAYRSQYMLIAVQTSYDCWFNGESRSDSSLVLSRSPLTLSEEKRTPSVVSNIQVSGCHGRWFPKLRSSGFLLCFKSLSLFQGFGRPRCILSKYSVKTEATCLTETSERTCCTV